MNGVPEVVQAFSADQVVRLTGLTYRKLAYWDRIGFFKPTHATEGGSGPYARIYSFNDVVGLRTISVLQGKHGVSLKHLQEVARKLLSYTKTPWSDIQLRVWNRRVVFVEPETGAPREVVAGQYVLLPIIEVIEDVNRDVDAMKRRTPEQVGKVEKHRFVSHNAPVFAGTRVRVASIQRFIEDGYSPEQIMREYPSLTRDDIATAERMMAA